MPPQEKQRLLEAIWQLLQVMTVQAPVLLIVEDLHWVDASTLDLLTLLVQRLQTVPWYLLRSAAAGISGAVGSTGAQHGADAAAARAGRDGGAGDAGAGDTVLPAAVLEHIVTRSAGVPLFVEEVAQMVLASGVVAAPGADGRTEPLPAVALPRTVQALVAARLASLGAAAQRVAHGVAVWGRAVTEAWCG